ncbi:signal recognition particle-docking protein FtsY [Sinorhizobium alkalisoli]|uniref:Signal recognition particle receptor FtsY n=1 Tax=Sinorhizobium alkalisoli TaxID=1752398 RepID=A0A1E3VBK7_9HYPH|nr:signal recognition particle-docking protein FtsY [Sinorhizobium alkalisoli]MCA1492976.1 signal recognition particle-docking protein FtsY [Ensifer sp. NBAIM29]MCG5478216.1 signal recognition particle-docking protein FtsY [Sinorhizobium alkalisoli]ODR90925.1 signal recognition particle-docking protein FtsY [Sinorhizobium alkalisoli]
MAIGFIKKIFSFGKDTVEEKPVPPQEAAPETRDAVIADEAAASPPIPSGHLPHKGEQGETEAGAEDDRAAFEEAKLGAEDLPIPPELTAPGADALSESFEKGTNVAADEGVAVEEESAPHPISPLGGEMPGRAEGGEAPSDRAALADEAAMPPSVPSGHLPHKGGDQAEAAAPSESNRTEKQAGAEASAAQEAPEPSAYIAADAVVTGEEEPTPPALSPLEGEMPGKGGDATEAATAAPHLPKGFAAAERRPEEEAPAPQLKLSWYQRLRRGLARTSSQLTGQIASLFTKRKLDEATLQDLEDLLIQADLGVETAMRIADTLASERYGKDVTGEDVSRIMAGEITKVLGPVARPLELDLSHKPHVILVVGVNGTGKTTTIGKLAAKLSGAGLKVMLAAGDTFRAAAIEQLKIWAERTKSDIVASKLGADAAGLAYEAYERAREKKSDVLIIDTAGRLQNKAELMAELEKIVRVLGKLDPEAPHTVLQTLDATTGQNALQQVEIFRNVAGVSGLIMTKLDGTARGGILVAISAKHKLPVYFIGVGEGIDDLEPFEAKDFAEAIAGVGGA